MQRLAPLVLLCGLLLASLTGISTAQLPGATFQGIGGSNETQSSTALGLSPDGSTAVGFSYSSQSFTNEAFRWNRKDGIVSLHNPTLPAYSGEAWAASNGGFSIVGDDDRTGQQAPYRWTSSTGMVPIAWAASQIGERTGIAFDTTGSGAIVVGTAGNISPIDQTANYVAFIMTIPGSVEFIPSLPGSTESYALGVSNTGDVVVGQSGLAEEFQAFYWTASTGTVGLGDFPGGLIASYAIAVATPEGVSDMIIVGGGTSATGSEAFRWTPSEGMIALGQLPGQTSGSYAFGISCDGSTIVGQSGEAFLWSNDFGMRSVRDFLETDYGLDLSGWILTNAVDISCDGRVIVGNGVNPLGFEEAWIITLPECFGDSDCDDGVFCTDDTCGPDFKCKYTANSRNCDDGLFCTGAEVCDPIIGCITDLFFSCNDNTDCTIDTCNEETDSCEHTPDDSRCNDGLFCNGDEYCSLHAGCVSHPPPCQGLACDEENDFCYACQDDLDCDDGVFCNGPESCDDGTCLAGTNPCALGTICDESAETCTTNPVPSTSAWGLATLLLLILVDTRRRRFVAS